MSPIATQAHAFHAQRAQNRASAAHAVLASRQRTFTRAARRSTAVRASLGNALLTFPLFPLPTVLHPGQTGTVCVFEPRYLQLFRDFNGTAAPSSPAAAARFGHILSPTAAPPALLASGSVSGLPTLGVVAAVRDVQQLPDGRLLVDYVGERRFKLLAADAGGRQYMVGAAEWHDDDVSDLLPGQRAALDDLEVQVYRCLLRAAQLSQPAAAAAGGGAGGGREAGLPDAVVRYAPPPPPSSLQSTAQYLQAAGIPAGNSIATWQRMGSVYGTQPARQPRLQDPYQLVREAVGKERRQELFSFAAANMLELGLPERLALLYSRDTSARLEYVLAAVQPHLRYLEARAAVSKAVGTAGDP